MKWQCSILCATGAAEYQLWRRKKRVDGTQSCPSAQGFGACQLCPCQAFLVEPCCDCQGTQRLQRRSFEFGKESLQMIWATLNQKLGIPHFIFYLQTSEGHVLGDGATITWWIGLTFNLENPATCASEAIYTKCEWCRLVSDQPHKI